MKRVFNNRPLCFAAAALATGIIAAVFIFKSTVAISIFISLLFLLSVLLIVFKKTRRFTYLTVFILLGASLFSLSNYVYNLNSVALENTQISATVDSEIIVYDGKTFFYVKDILADGKKIKGRAKVSTSAFEPDFNAGDIVLLEGNIKSLAFDPLDTYFTSAYSQRNTLKINAGAVTKSLECAPNFVLKLEMKLKSAFFKTVKEDTASICISLIYGDKTAINSELYNDIKLSGLAHILAVSGSHITVLCAALYYLLKKLKLSKKVSSPILIVLLFLYSFFCGFSPSVLRAFLMASIFLVADALGIKKDNFSTLALSGIIILMFNPLALFELGFLLSFASVAGILLLYRSFDKVFKKSGKLLSPIISTNLAANIMTYPIVASSFKVFPLFSMLANILILPFISVIFIVLLIFALFVVIVPYPSVLIIFDYLLLPFKTVVFFASSLDISKIDIVPLKIMAIAYYFCAVLFSRFISLQKKYKVILALLVTAVCLVISIIL